MAAEIIGGVGVTITGDISPLLNSFGQAEAAATQAGGQISSAFNGAAASTEDLLARAEELVKGMRDEAAAASAASQATKAMAGSLQQVGAGGQQAGFNLRYLLFGLKDIGEGRYRFALAEAANELVRMGPAALTAGAAIAAIGGTFYGLIKLRDYLLEIGEITKEEAASTKEFTSEIKRLGAEIENIDNKRFADLFGEAAAKAKEAAEMVNRNIVGLDRVRILMAQTQIQTVQQQGPDQGFLARAGQAALRATLGPVGSSIADSAEQVAAKQEILRLTRDLDVAQLQLAADEKKAAELSIESSKAQAAELNKGGAKGPSEAEQLRKQDEEALAELQASHKLSIGETISFWQQRLAVEQSNADRLREITRTLGHAYQEQDDVFTRVAKHAQEVQDEAGKKAKQQVDFLQNMADEATKIITDQANKKQETEGRVTEIGQASAGEQAALKIQGQKIALEAQYGLQVSHTLAQQIANMQAVAALDAQARQDRITGLRDELATAEALTGERKDLERIAALKAEIAKLSQQDANATAQAAGAASKVAAQQSLGAQLGQAGQSGVQSLAGALAKGITDGGKGIGKDIRHSLENIGRQMLGDVIEKGMEETVIALTGNTIATNLNTVWTQLLALIQEVSTALFGFADGTDSAPGGFAMVGERGPEIMHVPRGAQIIPNHKIGAYADGVGLSRVSSSQGSGGGGDVHIYGGIHAHGITDSGKFMDHVARELPNRIKNRVPGRTAFAN